MGHRQGDGRDGLERGQRGQREHGHHDLTDVVRVDGGHAGRQHGRHGDAEADLNEQCRPGREAGVAALQRVGTEAEFLHRAEEARLGAEGEQLGRPGQRVDDLGREGAGERGHLVVAAAAPGEQRGHGQRDEEREAEGDARPTAV